MMPPRLSPRQTEIAQLVADGLADKTIADRLSISEHTVYEHLARIGRKIGAQQSDLSLRRAITRYVQQIAA